MTQPLALVVYENLLPGSQLVIRLQDLKYRVQTVSDCAQLVATAEQAKPMVVLVDLASTKSDARAAIGALKQNEATRHLPVIAFSAGETAAQDAAAQAAGAALVVGEAAILNHLPQILDQALQIE
jgi:CheY-like chemotaxis protein